jgi:CBS domain containing-hemolysin-like protein
VAAALAWVLAGHAATAQASFLSGEALDTAADVISWLVLVLVPVIAIIVFWIVHVMPEKIAHKRHHPQRDAIQTLCLLSLVFGGLLWPIAWLWAYSRPVMYRVAYGTDKHDDFFEEQVERGRQGGLLRSELRHLREELDAMDARGALPAKLARLREELDGLKASDENAVGGGA